MIRFESGHARLVEPGKVLIPPGEDDFSYQFAWLSDRFGVARQLNLGGDWISLLPRTTD